MTHLFDTSAVRAHYLNEPGASRFDGISLDPNTLTGISTLTLYEFDVRLSRESLSPEDKSRIVQRYIDVIVPLTEETAALGAALRQETSARIVAVDLLIAATALWAGAVLVHRDAHFAALPSGRPSQEALPDKH